LHVLHAFHGGTDGANPFARLFRDTAGNFYGTTYAGGTSNKGTVYKLDPSGTLTILYSFTGGADGGNPRGRVILDSKGNLYGTTPFGGTGDCNCGVVFKLSSTSTLTVLHNFAGGAADGANPYAGLLWDSAGNMYGTTTSGGSGDCDSSPCGTVFKVRTNGAETVLHMFDGSDGHISAAGLLLDAAGSLYGVTNGDDRGSNVGAVFKLDKSGTETVLHRFNGTDGVDPEGTLIQDSAGNLYGTAQGDGPPFGTIFKIAP